MKFQDLKFRLHGFAQQDATHAQVTFDNGYGLSVITGDFAFYCGDGTYEVAVTHYDRLCYATPITGDVLMYQTPEEITELMARVSELPKDKHCRHSKAKQNG